MKLKNKTILAIVLTFFFLSNVNAENTTYFIDFKKVLNESKAGAEAQNTLKKK